jgi:hypothetical protein
LLATAALILGSQARAEPDPPHSFVVELWTDTGLTALTDGGSTVDFGEVAKFADTTRIFTIRNVGTTLLTNLAITKGGTHQGEFSVGTPDRTALNPGKSANFNVRFSPFGKGPCEATLHIASNEFQATPFDIALVGRGVPPPGSRTTITFSTFPSMDNIVGWDVRVKDVNGGIPTLLVLRDEPPEFRDTMGWPSSPWGDEPSAYPLWPGGAIWRGGIDWTRFSYDEYLSFLGERLVMGMGRPLEPGTYFVGVYNSGVANADYTVESRGIGAGKALAVADLDHAAGSTP